MKILENLVDKRAEYSIANIVKVLFLISKEPLGRFELMGKLGLTEAPVKTMLKNLAKNKLIKSTIEGAVLDYKGKGLFTRITKVIPKSPIEIDAQNYTDYGLYKKLYKNRLDLAILVRNVSHKIRDGVEQHDIAVKTGAVGATTLVQKNNKIVFPSTWYEIKSEFNNYLKVHFDIKNNDAIIICFGPSYHKVEEAALTTALSLI